MRQLRLADTLAMILYSFPSDPHTNIEVSSVEEIVMGQNTRNALYSAVGPHGLRSKERDLGTNDTTEVNRNQTQRTVSRASPAEMMDQWKMRNEI
jgi:hypothetical protein